MDITIYTDGGCKGNPGPGGWAFVDVKDDGNYVESGADKATTNNKMELTAVIKALEYCDANYSVSDEIVIYTDSQYVKNGISTWIHGWLRNGWKTAAKKPVKNQEYWQELHALNTKLKVQWRWVKGHSGVEYNELCDSEVQKAMATVL